MKPPTTEQDTSLNIVRALFVITSTSVGWQVAHMTTKQDWFEFNSLMGLFAGLAISIVVVTAEARFAQNFFSSIFAVISGLFLGFIGSYLLNQGLLLLPQLAALQSEYQQALQLVVTLLLCYLCVAVLLKTRDNFMLLIPFVEFSKQEIPRSPRILDSSVLIDGRIIELCESGFVEGPLVLPAFILNELQQVADSNDRLRRNRGRRGLDIANALRHLPGFQVILDEEPAPGSTIDEKLLQLAKKRSGRILTNDVNLKKVADVQGIQVLNLNEVAVAMKAVALPGEILSLKLIKEGDNPGQTVAYLEDGTLVVVEESQSHLGETVDIVITRTIQKPTGRILFGRIQPTSSE
ncbi:MAG: PIN/TRAM domain-containing protein [Planctomycetota bacterium]|jgi:uncharacterized protein YacL|nr:PIN/TRAM domain-containing protein [Planctomycetota bacterium]